MQKFDRSSCEWNQFVKDFCADEQNQHFKNKFKAASKLWKLVRTSTLPKVYTSSLIHHFPNAFTSDESNKE